jgi:hypothetical protein
MTSYAKKFNVSGDLSEEAWFDNAGKIINKSVPTYEKNGIKTGEDWLDSNNKLIYRDVYRFSADGRKSEEIWYDLNGQVIYKVIYSYDDKKNTTKRIGYRGDGRRVFQMDCTFNNGKDAAKDNTKDAAKDNAKDAAKDNTKDAIKDSDKDIVKDPAKDAINKKELSTTCISSSGTYFQQYSNTRLDRFWFSTYGSIFGKELYVHNSDGQLSEYTLNDTMSDVVKRVFKYDEKGNVTDEIIYNRIKEPILMIRYIYEYY